MGDFQEIYWVVTLRDDNIVIFLDSFEELEQALHYQRLHGGFIIPVIDKSR